MQRIALAFAALGLLGGCGSKPGTTDVGTASLEVTSRPAADVWVDGDAKGVTPATLSLPAGDHEVVLRLGGFEAHEEHLALAAGGAGRLSIDLVARDVEDRQVLQILARPFKLWIQPFSEPEALRGDSPVEAVRVVYPRGPVRTDDLSNYRVEFEGAGVAVGGVEFRRGATLLAREDVTAPARGDISRPVPPDVRKAVANGDKITWGFYPKLGPPVTSTFDVVQRDMKATLEGLAAGMKGQPETAVAHLKAQILLDAGLFYAAHQEAQRILSSGQPSLRAWAVTLEALDKMGASKGSAAWKEAQQKVGGFAPAMQQEAYPRPSYAITKIVDQMREGQAGRVLDALDAQAVLALAKNPADARDIAGSAAANATLLAMKAPGSAKKVAETLLTLAKQARQEFPSSRDGVWALSEALLAGGRIAWKAGEKPSTDRWLEAADVLIDSYKTGTDGGEAYARAVQALHEAARLEWADRAKILARSAKVCEEAKARYPESPRVAAAVGSDLLERASTMPEKARKEAKQALGDCFAALQPHLVSNTPDISVATLHAEAVTLNRAKHWGLAETYRTDKQVSLQNLLRFEIPLSSRWIASPDLLGKWLVLIRETNEDGGIERIITVRSFQFGIPYVFPGGREPVGENIQLLSKSDQEDAERGFQKVKKSVKSHADVFTHTFPKAYVYEVTGVDRDGGFRRVRSYFFKSEEHKLSYQLTIQDYEALPDQDEELDFVLESFADVKQN